MQPRMDANEREFVGKMRVGKDPGVRVLIAALFLSGSRGIALATVFPSRSQPCEKAQKTMIFFCLSGFGIQSKLRAL